MKGSRSFWDSIRWRAALLTSGLVAASLTAFTWYTVARVEADLIASGIERAETATSVLASQTAQSNQQGFARMSEIARDPTIRAALRTRSDAATREAVATIRRAGGPGPDQRVEAIELWDAGGDAVVEAAFPQQTAGVMLSHVEPTAAGLAPLQTRGDVLFTRTVVDVPGDPAVDGHPRLGYLVISRLVRPNASSTVLNGIVGNGAIVLLGNQSGSVWTDLGRIVPAPAIDLRTQGGREFRGANGTVEIGAPSLITGTPWVLVIAFPRSVVVAPAWQLLRRLVAASVALTLLATIVAGTLGGRVTKPLGDLTLAAQAIASGDYSRRVAASRRDEVGQLSQAFNVMATHIERGRSDLETRATELAASREAERHANRVKDDFLAVLSHELRTPLSAMLGWCQMLREGVVPADRTGHALRVIERNATAQLHLVEDLLDVSRIVAGKFTLEMQRVDPAAVVAAAIESIRPVAVAKDVTMTVAVDPGAGAGSGDVDGDPGRLQQAVWNVLANAIKFTPRGGTVSVRVGHEHSSVFIEAQDSGEGISAEALPHVFERLQQGDSGSTRRHTGLGLGLAIVKQVIELHRGTVSASSKGLGQGATFRIELPLAEQEATAPARRSTPAVSDAIADPPGASMRGVQILVVEDADDARDLLSELLTAQGAVVTAARSAERALDWLRLNRPDVIISDIEMSGLDGLAMMREIRSEQSGLAAVVPAIALTAYAAPEDRDRSLASGFQAHLIKPVNLGDLFMTIASRVTPAPGHHAPGASLNS